MHKNLSHKIHYPKRMARLALVVWALNFPNSIWLRTRNRLRDLYSCCYLLRREHELDLTLSRVQKGKKIQILMACMELMYKPWSYYLMAHFQYVTHLGEVEEVWWENFPCKLRHYQCYMHP